MTRRKQWRLVAGATKRQQRERRGFLTWLLLLVPTAAEKVVNLGGWKARGVYGSGRRQPLPKIRRPLTATLRPISVKGTGAVRWPVQSV